MRGLCYTVLGAEGHTGQDYTVLGPFNVLHVWYHHGTTGDLAMSPGCLGGSEAQPHFTFVPSLGSVGWLLLQLLLLLWIQC